MSERLPVAPSVDHTVDADGAQTDGRTDRRVKKHISSHSLLLHKF